MIAEAVLAGWRTARATYLELWDRFDWIVVDDDSVSRSLGVYSCAVLVMTLAALPLIVYLRQKWAQHTVKVSYNALKDFSCVELHDFS